MADLHDDLSMEVGAERFLDVHRHAVVRIPDVEVHEHDRLVARRERERLHLRRGLDAHRRHPRARDLLEAMVDLAVAFAARRERAEPRSNRNVEAPLADTRANRSRRHRAARTCGRRHRRVGAVRRARGHGRPEIRAAVHDDRGRDVIVTARGQREQHTESNEREAAGEGMRRLHASDGTPHLPSSTRVSDRKALTRLRSGILSAGLWGFRCSSKWLRLRSKREASRGVGVGGISSTPGVRRVGSIPARRAETPPSRRK